MVSGTCLESASVEGETPVRENPASPWMRIPSSSEPVKFAVNLADHPLSLNTSW